MAVRPPQKQRERERERKREKERGRERERARVVANPTTDGQFERLVNQAQRVLAVVRRRQVGKPIDDFSRRSCDGELGSCWNFDLSSVRFVANRGVYMHMYDTYICTIHTFVSYLQIYHTCAGYSFILQIILPAGGL